MAFRYLIYRSDYGNTVVRENSTSSSTGGTEAELYTDFVIPEIQPLYLWRVNGGTTIIPNTDENINNWLSDNNPPTEDDPITYDIYTGYTAQTQVDLNNKVEYSIFNSFTAQTQTDLNNKINIVTGATGNIGEFNSSGNLINSGFGISDLTGITSNDGVVSGGTLNGNDLELRRTEGLSDVVVDLSSLIGTNDGVVSGATLVGDILTLRRTEGLSNVTTNLSGLLGDVETDISSISATSEQNKSDIQLVSGVTTTNTNIINQNSNDIIYISGITDTKQDNLSAGGGINSTKLVSSNLVELDFNSFTAVGDMNISITGTTNAVLNDLRTVAKGFEYGNDYSGAFSVRSLVDKGYVDAIASGLDLKESVVLASLVDIDLTLGSFGGTIDGVNVQDGDRVLIKSQTSKEDNGIYVYSSGGNTFARAIDFDNPHVTAGAFTFVETGNTLSASGWVLVTQDPINIGTTELTFTQFSEAGSFTAGHGIDITTGVITFAGGDVDGNSILWSGNTLNVDVTTGTLAAVLANKLEVSLFNSYTGTSETRFTNIESDISSISGDVIQNITDINYISGITDTKLDTNIFTGYTASTVSNELVLVHTGGTDVNQIIPVEIIWNTIEKMDSSYSVTGGTSTIVFNDAGEYEISYNVPFNQSGNDSDRGIGGNLILNGTTVINNSVGAGWTSRSGAVGTVSLSNMNLSVNINDKVDLVLFRTARNGTTNTSQNGTLIIKRKNKLQ